MEKEKKNGFVFYESWYDGAKELKPKHRGIYLEAIIKFGLFGEETELKGIEKALFSAIKPTIKFNKKQRDNGLKGGGNQGNSNARKTTQIQAKNDPNSAIYLDDKDIDEDEDKDKDLSSSSSFIDEFFEIENEVLGRRDEIEMSAQQIELLAEKYDEKGAAVFREFWAEVKKSDWLQEQDLCIMLTKRVFENVLEGVYRTYKQRQTPAKARDLIGTNFIDRD